MAHLVVLGLDNRDDEGKVRIHRAASGALAGRLSDVGEEELVRALPS